MLLASPTGFRAFLCLSANSLQNKSFLEAAKAVSWLLIPQRIPSSQGSPGHRIQEEPGVPMAAVGSEGWPPQTPVQSKQWQQIFLCHSQKWVRVNGTEAELGKIFPIFINLPSTLIRAANSLQKKWVKGGWRTGWQGEIEAFPSHSLCRGVLIQLSPLPLDHHRTQHLHFPCFHPVPKAGKHQCPESQSFSSEQGWSPAGFATTQKGQLRAVHQSHCRHWKG